MNLRATDTTRPAAPSTVALLLAALILVATGARAQGNACDQLKATLAARIEASGVRGYSLETVPSGTPVPSGAKAIGNCEGGARKILYRRWGASQQSPRVEAAAQPAAAPQAVVAPEPKPRPAPAVQNDRALKPVPASAPVPAPPPVSRSSAAVLAVPAPPPATEPARPPTSAAAQVEPASAIERGVERPTLPPTAQTQPTQTQADEPLAAQVPLAQQASEFITDYWRWLGALLLLPLSGGLWAWRVHRSAYDENGLPRGPKL